MPQPFIMLRLVDDESGGARRINVNASHIQAYAKWATASPGSDYREGIVNSVVTVLNGNHLYVRETPAEIQALLAGA